MRAGDRFDCRDNIVRDLDAQGFLHVAGRRNRMVTIADQNVFPEDIETLLLAQPGVDHAAVLPRPDTRRGTTLVALIAGSADPDALLQLCRTRFGPLAAPRRIATLADFPLLASGKPDLIALARRIPE